MRGIALSLAAALLVAADPYEARRERMVRDQLEARDIADAKVLSALRRVPRHELVPESVRHLAYEDYPLPIGGGQTISQPYIVALMTQLLEVGRGHRVLEIGTGSGYQAAVLSLLAGQVFSIEIRPELAREAASALRRLGYANVTVRQGNGYLGWPGEAPFDRIIVTAAPPELPRALLDQLKPGGRLVAPVGSGAFGQELRVWEKAASGKVTSRGVIPVRFVPMVQK